jgi:hypothetical protein
MKTLVNSLFSLLTFGSVRYPYHTTSKHDDGSSRITSSTLKHTPHLSLKALLCLLATTITLSADFFDAGVDAYHQSKYSNAIDKFESAVTDQESAAARHNLALSYFQEEQLGEATWHLERATRLGPLNTSYQFKLGALRQQLGLYDRSMNWWQSACSVFPMNTWILIATVCFWVLLGLILIPRIGKMSRLITVKLTTLLSAVGLSLCIAAIIIHYFDMPSGVVIADEPVILRHAPASAAPEAGIARPGERVTITERYEDYVKVETEAEIVGWLPAEDFRAL